MHTAVTAQAPNLMALISAAVTPVVLISAVAIFFSALTSKYGHLSDQFRQLTAEFRKTAKDDPRRQSIERQLGIFLRRIDALWVSSGMLSLALLCFVTSILLVLASQRVQSVGMFGLGCIVSGLILMLLGVIAELYEIALGRLSLRFEDSDILRS